MRPLRPHQAKAIDSLRTALRSGSKRPMLQAPTGCHAAGTPILMFDGHTKAVEDIVVGDWLMGPDSSPRIVLELHRGEDEMFEVRPLRGEAFTVNAGHILSLEQTTLPAGNSLAVYNGEWLNISVADYLSQNATFRHIHKLHRSRGVNFEGSGELPLEPYLLGVILGDGSIKRTRVGVTTEDREIADYLHEIAPRYGLSVGVYRSTTRATAYSLSGGMRGGAANPIMSALELLGLRGCGSADKFIPHPYKVASRSERLELLAGLIDTDGHLRNGGFDYVSKSPLLADDVTFVARSLGLSAARTTKVIRAGRYAGNIYHRVSIHGDTSEVPTKIARKRPDPRMQIKSPNLTGFKIEPVGRGEYFGFTVNEDNLYLMGDFTVTHNSGKTVLAAAIIEMARAKGSRVIFTVPAIPLIDQTAREFWNEGIREVGVIQADHPMTDPTKPVQIASVQTLRRREIPEADLVIVDEAHRISRFVEDWMSREEWLGVPFIGLSATPWSKGLGRLYDRLIIAATTKQLIEQGYLSDFRVFAPTKPDLTGVRIRRGDYDPEQLSQVMCDRTLTADIVSTWVAKGEGRPTLCFAVDRNHAKTIQIQFEQAGIPCGYLDGLSTRDEREEVRQAFASGQYKVVCNVGVLTTGVDWDVRCIIMARPTRSEILFCQIIGRGLRTAPGKQDLLILDHSDTTLRLGFVTDIHHSSLNDGTMAEGTRQAGEREPPKPKECPKCKYVRAAGVPHCPNCGHVAERSSEVETRDGELVEIKGAKKANREVEWPEKIAFMRQLKAYEIEKGHKRGWAANKYREKFGVWPNDPRVSHVQPAAGVSKEVRSWITSRNIRYAKAKGKFGGDSMGMAG